MNYAYYPGCALEKNAEAYHTSTLAVADKLGMDLQEIDDWNCCGATEYVSVRLLPAYALVGRNLALAAQQTHQSNGTEKRLLAPCSACFLNLSKVNRSMEESAELASRINLALAEGGAHYEPGTVRVMHLLEAMVRDVGLEAIAERVVRPLYGLRVAPYYGCLIVRPAYEGSFDDPEYPTSLDRLLAVLGAEVIDFPLKTHCCGGHMTQISEEVAFDLIGRLLRSAEEYESDVIATLCPMCQLNLDGYQNQIKPANGVEYNIPTLYFTQLMGLAFGLDPEELGLGREFVDARPALRSIADEPPKRERRRPNKNELPTPRLEEEPR